MSSTLTVTQRPSAWRIAASAAAGSASRMITPPCTLPATLASVTSISWVSVTWDALTGLGSPAVIRASYASGVTACGSRYRGREKRFDAVRGAQPENAPVQFSRYPPAPGRAHHGSGWGTMHRYHRADAPAFPGSRPRPGDRVRW